LHHESSADSVKRVGNNTSTNGDDLGEGEESHWVSILHVREKDSLTSVEATKVRSTICDNTNDWDTETLVETLRTISGGNLLKAINETAEFTGLTWADVSSESSSGEVEWVYDTEGSSTSSTTGQAVSDKELDGFLFGVVGAENLFVNIFESKVKCLSWEVSDDVSQVTSPESSDALFWSNTLKAVTDTSVLL
jgi:hypothetical protein